MKARKAVFLLIPFLFAFTAYCWLSGHAAETKVKLEEAAAIQTALAESFPEFTAINYQAYQKGVTLFTCEIKSGGSEILSAKKELDRALVTGEKISVFTITMNDRLKKIESMIDNLQFDGFSETIYLLMIIHSEGATTVFRKSGAEKNEAKGSHENIKIVSLIGNNSQQLSVDYVSWIQTDSGLGGRKKTAIYALPTCTELFQAVVADGQLTGRKIRRAWDLSYTTPKTSGVHEIRRKERGDTKIEVYRFNGQKYVLDHTETQEPPQVVAHVQKGQDYYAKRMLWKPSLESVSPIDPGSLSLADGKVEKELADEEILLLAQSAYPEAANPTSAVIDVSNCPVTTDP